MGSPALWRIQGSAPWLYRGSPLATLLMGQFKTARRLGMDVLGEAGRNLVEIPID